MASEMSARPPRSFAARRAVTLPVPSSTIQDNGRNSLVSPSPPAPYVETLFQHPSVRIVSFSTQSAHSRSKASLVHSNLEIVEAEIGTLPWTSRFERTIAVGPLHVYRAPGSVAFLNCGSIVKPIFPKSRCWCVDDASTQFVLQMKRPEYWRIELPAADENDSESVEGLRKALSDISLFEKTACPFRRNFTVPLPEAPLTPIKKRPWRPVERPTPGEPETQTFCSSAIPGEWETSEGYYSAAEGYYSAASGENANLVGTDGDSDASDNTDATPRNKFPVTASIEFVGQRANERPGVFRAGRSVTAPPQLTLVTSPPSKQRTWSSSKRREGDEPEISELSSSVESFHSVLSWHSSITPLPLSPSETNPTSPFMFPYPHDNIALPKRTHHTRDLSELTITSETPQPWHLEQSVNDIAFTTEDVNSISSSKFPKLVDDIQGNLDDDHFDISAPATSKLPTRYRPLAGSNSRARDLSPLPPAANLISPPQRQRSHRSRINRNLSNAIIHKTCEILLSPPSHLLNIMLDIAARIAAGEWRGMVFGFGEGGEKIVGQWDYDDGELVGDTPEEDDYGISLAGNQKMKRRSRRSSMGDSWEIDWHDGI